MRSPVYTRMRVGNRTTAPRNVPLVVQPGAGASRAFTGSKLIVRWPSDSWDRTDDWPTDTSVASWACCALVGPPAVALTCSIVCWRGHRVIEPSRGGGVVAQDAASGPVDDRAPPPADRFTSPTARVQFGVQRDGQRVRVVQPPVRKDDTRLRSALPARAVRRRRAGTAGRRRGRRAIVQLGQARHHGEPLRAISDPTAKPLRYQATCLRRSRIPRSAPSSSHSSSACRRMMAEHGAQVRRASARAGRRTPRPARRTATVGPGSHDPPRRRRIRSAPSSAGRRPPRRCRRCRAPGCW